MDNKKYYIIGGVLVLLLVLGAVVFLASPSGERTNGGDIELVWWKPFEESQNVQDLINDYQAVNKNVRITYVKKDINDYEDELLDALAAGNGPDIFSIHNDWLPKHSDKLAPMPDSLMSVRTYNDTFVEVATDDFVTDGKIYSIPLAVDLLALYYNKDILGSVGVSEPPKTWNEFLEVVKKVTKVDSPGSFSRSGAAIGSSNNVNRAVDILTLLMLQNGTKFYAPGFTNAIFDQSVVDPETQKPFNPGALALEYYTQFALPSKTSYTWNTKSDFSVDAFTQGKVAMMINYAYMQPTIKDKAPNLNWGVAAVPQTSLDVNKINFANYWGESVSKSTKNQLAAWDFLRFISSREELQKYYEKHKLVSSRKDMLPGQISDTEIGVFAENALTARSVYKKDAESFESIFLKMIDDVVLRSVDPDQAVRSATQQINLDLQRR